MHKKQEIFTLLNGRIKMYHGSYNPTSDAVWLAASVSSEPKKVLDVGIGTGGVTLCLATHYPNAIFHGIDSCQQKLIECEQNATLNDINIQLIHDDIFTWKTSDTFDLVITNPPYFKGTPAKHNAHHNTDLTQWIQKCCARVKPHGTLCVISDATTLNQLLNGLGKHWGNINIFPLFGGNPRQAERVILTARLGFYNNTIIHSALQINNDLILRQGLTINNILSKLQ